MLPMMLPDDDDGKKGTSPPLLMFTELTHTAADWYVIYHFFLGPLDGHFTLHLGHLDEFGEEEAKAKARDPKSPLLARAHLALLQAVQLETTQ
jgi:hypothetical protein